MKEENFYHKYSKVHGYIEIYDTIEEIEENKNVAFILIDGQLYSKEWED